MLNLGINITKINRVGATTAKRLKILGIETIDDLLFYFPYRYEDYSKTTPIASLISGLSANVVGQIDYIQTKRSPRKRMYITEAIITDKTDSLKVVWFNQPFISRNLKSGNLVSLAGKPDKDYSGFIMKSPNYEKIPSSPSLPRGGSGGGIPSLAEPGLKENAAAVHTQGLVPIYHLTANITQKQIRFLINEIIKLTETIIDWLPADIIRSRDLINLGRAARIIHFPANYKEIAKAKKRLAFNELFLIQLRAQLIRQDMKHYKAPLIKFSKNKIKEFVSSLPFELTNSQKRSTWEIIKDLEKDKPMTRLLEGDVGSGKTVVAVLAMLNTALNKKQSVLMVPTEILAQQHFDSIAKLLKNAKIPIGLITSSKKAINIEAGDKKINSKFLIQHSKIVIGTHALIQKKIKFKNLALVIVDEQHRFGVEQRKTLIQKSSIGNRKSEIGNSLPHLLSMTATPIPRSLALALFGELDLSIIKEMPKGRKPIMTRVVPEDKREQAYKFIRKKIKEGRQVFVICPLIDISDKLGVKSVKEEFKKLDKSIFPDISISMLHGRLKAKEKEAIMAGFVNNKTKILVSTSVVEVGVDIPNACVMMIEGADRFGLAQLHQFRGRVGRSEHQSYCLLFSDNQTPKTRHRLSSMEKYNNGFDLAKIDLKFRGPGEVFGTAQKGFPELKIASIFDYELSKIAQTEAINIIKKDPKLKKSPDLKQKLGDYKKLAHLE